MAGEGSGQGEGSQMVGGGELCNLPTQCPVTRGKSHFPANVHLQGV